jgi:uncharacterized DUF497 family protein
LGRRQQKASAGHSVTAAEFGQVMNNDPPDLDYEITDGEERYRSVGGTSGGRFLLAVWTVRDGKIRAITAFPAGVSNKKAFLERRR